MILWCVLVLAFESSCDETCAAVVDGNLKVLSNAVSSQIEIHKLYGGVVPEIASRNHVMAVQTVYEEALGQAGVTLDDITHIAATTGPGLRGAVMVGQVFAESLAAARKIPFIEVNHLAGHIASAVLAPMRKGAAGDTHNSLRRGLLKSGNFLSLLVSGGHTSLYHVRSWGALKLICETSDDACGEAFDKAAKILGLGYPGGVQIEKLAKEYSGNDYIKFVANPSKKDGFSYSGLKTALLNFVNKEKAAGRGLDVPRICASFQHEAIEQAAVKCEEEMKKLGVDLLCVGGGVSANGYLRGRLPNAVFPEPEYCGDNAAMIAAAAVLEVTL